jgi:pimeloyl-ACP methyl ester carboxylesterase
MEHLLTDAYAQKPDPEAVSGYLTPLKQKGTASSIVDMLVNLNEQFAFRSEQIKMPALVIWGEKDTWVPLKDGEAFFVKLPDARMHLIPGAGHCPQETHSEVVNRILIGFLEE